MPAGDITLHGPTGSGSYNVIGMDASGFFLQGGLTLAQVAELRTACTELLRREGVKV